MVMRAALLVTLNPGIKHRLGGEGRVMTDIGGGGGFKRDLWLGIQVLISSWKRWSSLNRVPLEHRELLVMAAYLKLTLVSRANYENLGKIW